MGSVRGRCKLMQAPHGSRVKPLFVGVRRPTWGTSWAQVSDVTLDAATRGALLSGATGLSLNLSHDSLRGDAQGALSHHATSTGALHQQSRNSLGSQEQWSTTIQGLCTFREFRPCPKVGGRPKISHTYCPSSIRTGAPRNERTRSFFDTTRRRSPIQSEDLSSPLREKESYR